jgi:hypothetical protein
MGWGCILISRVSGWKMLSATRQWRRKEDISAKEVKRAIT